jgi:beta-galactosidase
VFTNCDMVVLRLNGEPVERADHQSGLDLQHLPHPPWFFDLPRFVPGVLEAIGFVNGVAECRHRVATPGAVAAMTLHVEDLGIRPTAGEPDLLLAHAELRDEHGTLCVGDSSGVKFQLEGKARLLGRAVVAAEAGIATVVVQVPGDSPGFVLRAEALSDSRLAARCDWRLANPTSE